MQLQDSVPNAKAVKKLSFVWNKEYQSKLTDIISEIESEVELNCSDYTKSFTLETDASNKAIRAILLLGNKPIGFYSYNFSAIEQRYSVTEKETLSLLKWLEHFKSIIFNSKIIINTNNKISYLINLLLFDSNDGKCYFRNSM